MTAKFGTERFDVDPSQTTVRCFTCSDFIVCNRIGREVISAIAALHDLAIVVAVTAIEIASNDTPQIFIGIASDKLAIEIHTHSAIAEIVIAYHRIRIFLMPSTTTEDRKPVEVFETAIINRGIICVIIRNENYGIVKGFVCSEKCIRIAIVEVLICNEWHITILCICCAISCFSSRIPRADKSDARNLTPVIHPNLPGVGHIDNALTPDQSLSLIQSDG